MKFEAIHLAAGPLQEMREFYENTLGFHVSDASQDQFTVNAGDTTITFSRAAGRPYYHFAFNIPSFSIREAAHWLRERVEILDFRGADIVDFAKWNAEAVYFYDPGGNILEFIARKNLKVEMEGPFDAQQVLCVSELGWSSHDMKGFHARVVSELGIENYDCDPWRFCAVGSETGLFIMVDPEQKGWIPRFDPALVQPFRCTVRTHQDFLLDFDGGRLVIKPLE